MVRAVKAILLLVAATSLLGAASYRDASGAVRVVGYADMRDLLDGWDALYAAHHDGERFALALSGTKAAPGALASGESAFAPMGAAFTSAQSSAYRAATGRTPIGFRIARGSLSARAKTGPLVVFVNAVSPVTAVSDAEVVELFTAGLHGRDSVPICGLAASAVQGESFRDRELGGRPFAASFRGFPQSTDVVRAVAADSRAFGFARANVVTPAVRVVATYERYLYLYVRDLDDPLVRDYVRTALSPEGQDVIARSPQDYRPLTAAERAAELAALGR